MSSSRATNCLDGTLLQAKRHHMVKPESSRELAEPVLAVQEALDIAGHTVGSFITTIAVDILGLQNSTATPGERLSTPGKSTATAGAPAPGESRQKDIEIFGFRITSFSRPARAAASATSTDRWRIRGPSPGAV